jgi:hypothetical protein
MNKKKSVFPMMMMVVVMITERILYMHDGAPPYFSCAVREVLNNTYRE